MPAIDFDHPPADPIAQAMAWFKDAEGIGLPNPNAMTLATIDPDGRPSARIVLLRGFDERGAAFYTNRESRKGVALAAHPRASLLFHWDPLDRQIRIEGAVAEASDEESDAYFAKRPRENQINAWASQQSRPVDSRQSLEDLHQRFRDRFEGGPVPRPPHWGGYRVALERIEFWQGHPHRLHDRVVYTRQVASWALQRLCP
jgi:pyridoxamine 5'-phosphate oxidase